MSRLGEQLSTEEVALHCTYTEIIITLTRSTADRGDDAVGGQGRGREGGHAGVLQHDDGGHQETHQLLTCCCYSKIGINFNCSIHSNHFTKCLSRPN